jgi:cytochrome bd-type quinol oxidase subunit 1
MGLFLAAVLVPVQLFFGHLNGEYVHDLQPAKFAAIEARWHDEQPAADMGKWSCSAPSERFKQLMPVALGSCT